MGLFKIRRDLFKFRYTLFSTGPCDTEPCQNGGTCMEGYGDETNCNCIPGFTGDSCEHDVQNCPAEENVPVYPGSQINYNWPQTGPGSNHSYPCPDICQTFIDYPPEAMVVRVCHNEASAAAEWLDTDITGCGFSATALELCEANQVCCIGLLGIPGVSC